MTPIRWTPEASTDLEHISLHIAESNPEAALKTVRNIFERIEQLASFPNLGRLGREEGTRELVCSPLPYIVVYRLKHSAIQILHIWHGAQSSPLEGSLGFSLWAGSIRRWSKTSVSHKTMGISQGQKW